jgi:hypothetical protein
MRCHQVVSGVSLCLSLFFFLKNGPKFLILRTKDAFALVTLLLKNSYFLGVLKAELCLFCFLAVKMTHFSQKRPNFPAVLALVVHNCL